MRKVFLRSTAEYSKLTLQSLNRTEMCPAPWNSDPVMGYRNSNENSGKMQGITYYYTPFAISDQRWKSVNYLS